jgi:hypothetical protein
MSKNDAELGLAKAAMTGVPKITSDWVPTMAFNHAPWMTLAPLAESITALTTTCWVAA